MEEKGEQNERMYEEIAVSVGKNEEKTREGKKMTGMEEKQNEEKENKVENIEGVGKQALPMNREKRQKQMDGQQRKIQRQKKKKR